MICWQWQQWKYMWYLPSLNQKRHPSVFFETPACNHGRWRRLTAISSLRSGSKLQHLQKIYPLCLKNFQLCSSVFFIFSVAFQEMEVASLMATRRVLIMSSRFIPFHPASSDGGRQDTGALPWCEAAEKGEWDENSSHVVRKWKTHSNVFKSVKCIQNIQYRNIFKHVDIVWHILTYFDIWLWTSCQRLTRISEGLSARRA